MTSDARALRSPAATAVLADRLKDCQAAIIDLDGTMCDTLGDFEAALTATFADLGLPPVSRAFIGRTVGKGSEYLLTQALAEAGGAPSLFDQAWQRYQVRYTEINGTRTSVYPGVQAGLALLRQHGWSLACVTNKPRAFATVLLERTGLAGFFTHISGGDSFARKKPDPMPLVETCKLLGTDPARTLMVGDSRNDAQAAQAAGCPVVLVTYGYNHGEPIHDVPALAHVGGIDALARALGTARG